MIIIDHSVHYNLNVNNYNYGYDEIPSPEPCFLDYYNDDDGYSRKSYSRLLSTCKCRQHYKSIREIKASPIRSIAQSLAKEIARLEAAGRNVNEQNLDLAKNYFVQPHYLRCQA